MSDTYEVLPVSRPVEAVVRPPGSKSITNRALVCAALANGPSTLTGALRSDDTRVMIDALNAVGVRAEESDAGRTIRVEGSGGSAPAIEADLFIGNSGTTVRFLTAMLTLSHGAFRLDGVERMRQRPIADLVNALNSLGANVVCEAGNGCPPLMVHANGLPGGEATVRGDISSQYLSGLLMAAPCASSPVALVVDGELVSKPYVRMTQQVMSAFGAEVAMNDTMQRFEVASIGYQGHDYRIEPDASAASYFWAAAAITGGEVAVEGLSAESLQGDVDFVRCLEQMGCEVAWESDRVTVRGTRDLRGVEVDMNAISDTAQTLAVVALFADGPTRITGVAHNRHKETDRIADLATELRRVGAVVEVFDDGLEVTPAELQPATIQTYDDHRMAMSLSLVGLRQPGIKIANPGCTAKTYPEYFDELEKIASPSR